MYMSPSDLIEPQFGELSLQKHLRSAELGGYRCTVLALPRLALDIDTVADADELLARPPTGPITRTAELLASIRSPAG